ncbi:MAG: UDP-N-acetylglucosamine 2-epimerase, partial [Gammaproteobacteria bacterium]
MAAGNRDDGAIVCVIGTRAQLIKMAPVMLALEAAGTPFRLVLTGQHAATMDELLAEFGVATPPRRLYDGAEVSGIGRMATWLPRVLWRALTSRRALFATTAKRRCVLVHGDTFSTLLGALIGRLRG